MQAKLVKAARRDHRSLEVAEQGTEWSQVLGKDTSLLRTAVGSRLRGGWPESRRLWEPAQQDLGAQGPTACPSQIRGLYWTKLGRS